MLVPWAIIKIFTADYKMAIGLKSGEKRIQALSDTVQIGFHALPHFGKRSHQSHSLLHTIWCAGALCGLWEDI